MSRLVSAGTNEEPAERDEAWRKAQEELEAKHKEKVRLGEQKDGKSLFDTLQANKAAKQEAFEESIRLKNQFRSLDEDEVDFLDTVLQAERAKEAEAKKQTSEQLDAFRRQQEEAEKAAKRDDTTAVEPETTESWSVGGRKRKKARDREGIGDVKLRRTSTTDQPGKAGSALARDDEPRPEDRAVEMAVKSTPGEASAAKGANVIKSPSPPAVALGLGGYSSDED